MRTPATPAYDLAAGDYQGSILFVNSSNANGSTTRAVSVTLTGKPRDPDPPDPPIPTADWRLDNAGGKLTAN